MRNQTATCSSLLRAVIVAVWGLCGRVVVTVRRLCGRVVAGRADAMGRVVVVARTGYERVVVSALSVWPRPSHYAQDTGRLLAARGLCGPVDRRAGAVWMCPRRHAGALWRRRRWPHGCSREHRRRSAQAVAALSSS